MKRWVLLALLVGGAVPCLWLAVSFMGRQDAAYSQKVVFPQQQNRVVGPAAELLLEVGGGADLSQPFVFTAYCQGGCDGLLVRLPEGTRDIPAHWRESDQSHYRLPPGAAGRLRLRNPGHRPVVITAYRFKNFLADNTGFPQVLLLLRGVAVPETGWGFRLGWLLLALALQLGGLLAASLGRPSRRWSACLVPMAPWLAQAAGWWLAGQGYRLVVSGQALAALAGVGGALAAALRWGPDAWRGLKAWAHGPLTAVLAQPADPAGRDFLERWAAPAAYGFMGAYLSYVAVFSLVPGWRAQEWTVESNTWWVMAALVAGVLVAWRLGGLAWLGRLGSLPGWGVLLIALFPRLAWALLSGVTQDSDCRYFAGMALCVYRGDFLLLPFRDLGPESLQNANYWLVGTGPSIMAAGTYWLVGPWEQAALTLVALVSSLEVYLVYRIALYLWDRRVAAVAGLLLALCPTHLLFVNLMGSDIYFSFFITLSFYLVCRFRDRLRDLLWAFLGGVSLGTAQWMRPTMPLYLASLLIPLALLWARRPRKLAWLAGGLVLGTLLLLAPILSHNWRELRIVSINPSHMGSWSLLVGANLTSRGWFTFSDVRLLHNEVVRRGVPLGMNPLLFAEEVSLDLTRQRIAADPWGYLWLAVLHKPLSLWGRTAHQRHSLVTSKLAPWGRGIESVANYYYKLMVVLAAGALLWGGLRRRLPCGVLFSLTLAALLTSAGHMVLEVQPRYHFMFLPWLAMLAASWVSPARRA